jgi:pseudaminic acid synthase|tara:strand:- start:576 stop:1634 length:1059 start_codon:yes stop_codon:yes gene_type:complete
MNIKKIKIQGHVIGEKTKSFIIAEISGNHNQSFARLKKLIFLAKKSGADAVKLQTYTADTITINSNRKDFKINKKTPWKSEKNLWSLYNKAYTPWEWHKDIFKFCKKIKIIVFSSPFDESAVEMLEKLNCPAYKIASPEIDHYPLLEKIAKTGKPVIISRGLADYKKLKNAVKYLKKNGSNNIAILQCVSAYPAPLNEQNLLTIKNIIKDFKVISGLSDHSIGNISAAASIVLGGRIIEKHLDLDDKIKTVDHFFSSRGNQFKLFVKAIRDTEVSLGIATYRLPKSAKKNLNSMRSIYVSNNIDKGEYLTNKNIKVVRPSYSLKPIYYKKILGKKVKKNLKIGDRLKLYDLV